MRYLSGKLRQYQYISDRVVFVSLLVSVVLNIILWIFLVSKFGLINTPAPLHFSVVYGIDFVGPAYLIYEIPAVGFLVLVINLFLGWLVYSTQKLLSDFLVVASVFVQGILLIAGLALGLLI